MDAYRSLTPLQVAYGSQGSVLEFKNRFQIPPMCSYSSTEGFITDWHIARYSSFAMGGFGSIIVEATAVEPEGLISTSDVMICDDRHVEGLKRLTDAIHEPFYTGTKIGIQLAHAGRKASSSVPWTGFRHVSPTEDGGFQPKAPSAIQFGNSTVPIALSLDQLHDVQRYFIDAAERSVAAGFDFIQLHGAHGYLINEFLSPSTNTRTDNYGGSFENRIRFLVEIVDGIFERIGEFPLFVRLSIDEGPRNGVSQAVNDARWKVEDSAALAKILAEHGVCGIDCSFGALWHDQDWSMTGPVYQAPYTRRLKKLLVDAGVGDMCISVVGSITSLREVEELLDPANETSDLGTVDLVQLGRQALYNPFSPNVFVMEGVKSQGGDLGPCAGLWIRQHAYTLERLWATQDKGRARLAEQEED